MIRLNPSSGVRSDLARVGFDPGDVVMHRRYGYRGVVVAVDPCCQAGDDWYQSNKTQPDQNQPWCHVLVHGTVSATYAAESNLAPDTAGEPVEHPLVEEFFGSFLGSCYRRNSRPWPRWK